jgi:hypothetical protein
VVDLEALRQGERLLGGEGVIERSDAVCVPRLSITNTTASVSG